MHQTGSAISQFSEYQLLLKYLHDILRYKYRVAVVALLGAGLVFGLTWLLDEKFTAQATVGLNLSENQGGIKPSEYRGSNTIGVLEYGFIIEGSQSNERERHMARLESFGFISGFIREQNLLPMLFPKQWDVSTSTWLEGREPDMREAVKQFKSNMLIVGEDPKTELVNIRMTTLTPALSAELANQLVVAFNGYVRQLSINQLESRRAYLERRLTEVRNKETHRSIYRLLEAQLAYESLIYARDNYPLEIIQPAMPPLFESFPERKKWTALTLVLLVFVGFGTVVALAVIRRLATDLKAYAQEQVVEDLDQDTVPENQDEPAS